MLKDKVDNIKQALIKIPKDEKDNKDSKKSIENLITLAVVLIVTMIAINCIFKDDKKKKSNGSSNINSNLNIEQVDSSENHLTAIVNNEKDNLEKRLSDILSSINGVGEVKVLLTYSQTNKINPVYNEDEQSSTTEETDTSGGKRVINSSNSKKEVVYSNNNIITQSVSSPKIQGAVVIAKGASDIRVKSDIIQAVSAATGLSTYKIQVFEMS